MRRSGGVRRCIAERSECGGAGVRECVRAVVDGGAALLSETVRHWGRLRTRVQSSVRGAVMCRVWSSVIACGACNVCGERS